LIVSARFATRRADLLEGELGAFFLAEAAQGRRGVEADGP
jgi:hypothetical protein